MLFEKRDEVESTQLLQDDTEYKHRVQRPEGFETLCKSDPSCPEDCDACCKLPYHNITGDAFPSILGKIFCEPFFMKLNIYLNLNFQGCLN